MSPAVPRELRGPAPAKVNIGLAVTGLRADGYHELRSVFLRLALADSMSVGPGDRAGADSLLVEGDPDCPVAGNLVLRAVAALRAAVPGGSDLPPLHLTLHKRIPLGGGLAGGSTDAATALRLAACAWGLAPDVPGTLRLGARLGADVPFFIGRHPAALVTGIGERIEPLPPLRAPVGVVLVTPPWGMATPAVFAAFDRRPAPDPAVARSVDILAAAWHAGLDGAALAAQAAELRDANDLWRAVALLEPRMARLRAVLEATLGGPLLLTGSGSTLVGLYPSPGAASAAAARIAPDKDPELAGVRVVATRDGHPDDEEPAV